MQSGRRIGQSPTDTVLRLCFISFVIMALVLGWPPGAPATATTTSLYDGALGGTPDTQGFFFQARPQTSSATQVFSSGITTLTTTLALNVQAGYPARLDRVPQLDRAAGYSLRFTARVVAEQHADSDRNGDGIDDRAGFSVIVLSNDLRGIELGFWPDEFWAQEGDRTGAPAQMLFTHAEGAAFDTTVQRAIYDLAIKGNTYTLSSGGQNLLSGPLRDYSRSGFPYTVGNFIFFGDNTTSASAIVELAYVAVEQASPVPPPTSTPTATTEPTKPPVRLPLITAP